MTIKGVHKMRNGSSSRKLHLKAKCIALYFCGLLALTTVTISYYADSAGDYITVAPIYKPLAFVPTQRQLDDLDRVPSMLHPQSLSVCLHRAGTARDAAMPYDLIARHGKFSQRIQCYCLEEQPVDSLNCVLRLRQVTVFKSPIDSVIEVIMEDAPADFRVRGENAVEIYTDSKIYITGRVGCLVQRLPNGKCQKIFRKNYAYPYSEALDLTDHPVMLVATLSLHFNHYHAMLGPSGVLQITSTRAAINKFYHDENLKKTSPPAPFVPFVAKTKYQFPPQASRVTFAKYGSCSQIDFSATILENGSNTTESIERQTRFLRPQELPLSYLSPEILFGIQQDLINNKVSSPHSPMDWFGRRLGFCNQEIPVGVHTAVDDLWMNLLYGQMGTMHAMRQRMYPKALITEGVTYAEEYLTMCGLEEEERIAGRWTADKLTTVLSNFKPFIVPKNSSATSDPVRECLPVTRVHNGKTENYCVITIGREVGGDEFADLYPRLRGMPDNIEHAILNTLLMPIGGLRRSEANNSTSPIRGLDDRQRIEACLVDKEAKAKSQWITYHNLTPSTAHEALELLNHQAGRPPCATTLDQQPYDYNGLSFSNQSLHYPTNKLQRSRGIHLKSLPEQFAQIQEANLFIVEEGAGVTWSMTAKNGTTFVVLYNSNFARTNGKWLNYPYMPTTAYFAHSPDLFGKVRIIFLVYQYGRLPSFAKLREAFDRPFRAETIVVTCECNYTRVLPFNEGKPACKHSI